jgi:hypothetical protein
MTSRASRLPGPLLQLTIVALLGAGGFHGPAWAAEGGSESALSEKPLPYLSDPQLPARPAPLLEIGPRFLGSGNIFSGFELPTGAVWQPALWVFGDLRTGINYFDNGRRDPVFEWANRLDLFANLRLSGTERLLVGISPLRKDNNFSGYTVKPDNQDGWDNATNLDITTLFFEGEFGEIFPNLDPKDTGAYDVGFAIGRQPLFFQEGMMLNDTVDAIGITRDTVMIRNHVIDWRFTGLFGWNDINRDDNIEDENALLFGLFTEADFRLSTVDLDFAYVATDDGSGGDGAYFGASSVQRLGMFNTAFRANLSVALEDQTAAVSNGGLLFAEVSRTLPHGHDLLYGNVYWGIEEYSSAARDPTAGGPLGQVGILYAAVGLGRYGAALSNRPDDSVGAAVGYQKFFNQDRTQAIVELGGQLGTDNQRPDGVAIGTRIQQAIGTRAQIQVDGFVAEQENSDTGVGLRTELLVRF